MKALVMALRFGGLLKMNEPASLSIVFSSSFDPSEALGIWGYKLELLLRQRLGRVEEKFPAAEEEKAMNALLAGKSTCQ